MTESVLQILESNLRNLKRRHSETAREISITRKAIVDLCPHKETHMVKWVGSVCKRCGKDMTFDQAGQNNER